MKTLRPAPSRCLGSFLLSSAITAALAAAWVPLCTWIQMMHRLDRGGRSSPTDEAVALYGVLAVIAGVGLILALRAIALVRTRYEIGATDLVIHSGLLWRSTRTIPTLEILRIEVASGPVQRGLGYGDLHLLIPSQPAYPVKLRGVPRPEELRRHLLDRRANLVEAARAGDLDSTATKGEISLGRLADAIERLERRLGPAA
jgi:membrane protein YdbS with pleckstrin-like domain